MSGAIVRTNTSIVGSGYTAGDIIDVDQSGNRTATINIQTVDGSGVPLTYLAPEDGFPSRTLRGCGYTTQNNTPTAGGTGSGFLIDILSVGPGTDATHGGIFSLSITTAGSGYALNDTGLIVQGANDSSTYKVTGASGGGVIHLLVDAADGYALGAASLTSGGPQPGGGSGCTIDINDVEPCSFTPPPSNSGYVNRLFGGPSNQGSR